MKGDLLKSNFVVNEKASIQDAMAAITDNQRGAVIVTDFKGLFRGIVSDGDIRRGMLSGATQVTPIGKITNMNAKTVSHLEKDKALEIFVQRPDINLIPVIDKRNVIVDVIVRNPGERKII